MRVLAIAALCASFAVPILGQSIPRTGGTLLSGQPFVLPNDLTTSKTILIVGFSEKSAASSTEWGKQTRNMLAAVPSLASYQLPVLASVPRFIRSIVVGSMKKDVPPDLRGTFLPIFENESKWKQVVEFSAPDDAYVLLVDAHGSVLWRTHGAPTGERLKQLREAVARK